MKCGVVVFPGSNCDHDVFHALGSVVKQETVPLWHRSTDLEEAQKGGNGYPPIEDLWDVDDLGGWDALTEKLFTDFGIVTQAIAG